jgi:PHD/YefM family antitoxin component YafN of YafNO toxin-antitoxin module
MPVAIPNFFPIHLSSAEVANDFDHYIEMACTQHQIICVHGPNDQKVLIISQQDLEGWLETKYLMSTDANARALTEAIAELETK